jgi:hypothetical protein
LPDPSCKQSSQTISPLGTIIDGTDEGWYGLFVACTTTHLTVHYVASIHITICVATLHADNMPSRFQLILDYWLVYSDEQML